MKNKVYVTIVVEVEIDETKFDNEFMEGYRKSIDSTVDYIEDHIANLGWLYASGRVDNGDFIEGYGPSKEMGIKFREIDTDVELG